MKKLLTLVFAVSVFFCQSQSISIKYMETVDISSEIDAMEMPDDLGGLSAMFIKQLISSSMDKPSQFELLSNNEETIYQKIDSETDNENSNISMTISGNNDIIYTNYKEKSYTQQSDFMSRKFLINGELPQYDWVLTEETEEVAGYKCKKAINLSTPADTIYAWYTERIPHQYGPKQYNGLPGIILKLISPAFIIEASSVAILEENLEIKKPTKGKKVTQEEFDKIQEEKMGGYGGQDGNEPSIKVITM